MLVYFHKNTEDEFKYFGTWQDQHKDETFCSRTIQALGHSPSDVKIFYYPTALNNKTSFSFDDNFNLEILGKENQEVNGEMKDVIVVTNTIDGTQIFPTLT